MRRIQFDNDLPESFVAISRTVYKGLELKNTESHEAILKQLLLFKENQDLIIYTDDENVRMIGIFPPDSDLAYFGYWESTDAPELNKQAFDLLKEDSKNKGYKELIGPINFNTYLPYRVRVGKFPSWVQFDKEPVNPTYYLNLLIDNGFKICNEYESRMITKETIKDVYFSKESILNDLKTIPFDFIPITSVFWSEHREELYHLIHETFCVNPYYRKITFEQFNSIFTDTFVARLCPHSSVTFRDQKTGKLAAISLCHPNYMELAESNENISFDTHYHLLKKKTLLAKSVGVHPQFRSNGLMNFLGAYGMISFQEYYEEVLFCLMREGNFSLRFSDYFPHDKSVYALFNYKL